MTSEPPDLAERVRALAAGHWGATVTSITAAHGHSGRTWRVTTRPADRAGQAGTALALRLAPAGAPARGVADLSRQAEFMQAVRRHGVCAPEVLVAGSGPPWFDVGFHATTWVAGESVDDWTDEGARLADRVVAARLCAAVDVLVALQAVPTTAVPTTAASVAAAACDPIDELERWRRLGLRFLPEPHRDAFAARADDLAAVPVRPAAPVVVHGDFRLGNMVYVHDAAQALLDWELADLGHPTLDLAWLLLFADAGSWFGRGHRLPPGVRLWVLDRYAARSGAQPAELAWFETLARLRYAAIIGFNHHLHRTGRRVDPLWPEMALRVPDLLERA